MPFMILYYDEENRMRKFAFFVKNSSSAQRRIILAVIDFILISISLFIVSESFVKYSENSSLFSLNLNILFLAICGLILYLLTGQYTSLTRYATSKTAYYLALRNFIFVVFAWGLFCERLIFNVFVFFYGFLLISLVV